MSPAVFYEKYSTSFGKEGRGFKYTYYRQLQDGSFQKDNGSYWEMGQHDMRGRIAHNGYYTGPGSITKYGGVRKTSSGTLNNPYDYSAFPINLVDAWALEHDKSQATLIEGGTYGIQLPGYQGPLEDVRDGVF